MGGVAGGAPRGHRRDLGQVRQEGERDRDRGLQGGRPRGAPLRLDRRPHQARRRRLVHPALHAAARAQPLVEDQLREGGGADRERRDAAGRAGRGRAREGRRALGRRLRRAEPPRPCPTTCAPRSTASRRRASCSSASTPPTATRSCTASRRPRSPRRGRAGSRSSWRCSPAARRSTRCAAPVAAHLRVHAALVHRAPAAGAVAAAVEEQPAAVAAQLQPREPVRAEEVDRGDRDRPQRAVRMTPGPRPVAVLDRPLADRVGVHGEERCEGAARRLLAGRQRGEHVGDGGAQLARPREVGGARARPLRQRAGPARPGHEVRVGGQVVLVGRLAARALERVGEVERQIAAPELDVLDRARYHQNRVYP